MSDRGVKKVGKVIERVATTDDIHKVGEGLRNGEVAEILAEAPRDAGALNGVENGTVEPKSSPRDSPKDALGKD